MKFFSFCLILISNLFYAQDVYKRKTYLMGVDFEFAVVAEDSIQANLWLDEALTESQRIEELISSWKANSQTSQVNRMAGIHAVQVDKELFELIERSIRISKITNGYFDISFESINQYWHFDGGEILLPDNISIQQSIENINYNNIILNSINRTVYLKKQGMKIGFGAIGKGYVAERVKQLWKNHNASAGLINASGDISCFGKHPKNNNWQIAIKNPDDPTTSIAWFELMDSAVVTSGNYEKYVKIKGKKYAHIINPKTGWPVEGLKSVTIFCGNAELADGLATAVFAMGKERGINFIEQLKGVEALIIDEQNTIFQTKGLLHE